MSDPVEDFGQELGNRAIKGASAGWWAGATDGQKLAIGLLSFAAVFGPLGQGISAAMKLLYNPQIPSFNQLSAVFYLAIITLPVFGAVALLVYGLGRANVGFLLAAVGAVAYVGCLVFNTMAIPKLGDFYCYNDGRVLSKECRAFDVKGYRSAVPSPGGPSGAARALGYAIVYTSDARGSVMALCGIAAGGATGYLIRREVASS